ncbi:hypothetical protein JCM11251_001219 [Rhodosporidiobolus azoricus]
MKKPRTTAQKNAAQRKKMREQTQQQQSEQAQDRETTEDSHWGVYVWLARNKHLKYQSLSHGFWLSFSDSDLSTYLVVISNEQSGASLRGLLDELLAMHLSAVALLLPLSAIASATACTSSTAE